MRKDNTAPMSDAALGSIPGIGAFLFLIFKAQLEGRVTQEYDTTTERKLWFSGVWGRSLPTSFLQFGPDCIACHYYPEKSYTVMLAGFGMRRAVYLKLLKCLEFVADIAK